MADYYNLLGVARDATAEQIKSAFRKAAKRNHPDAHVQSTPRQQAEAQQRFIQLAQAYETLSHTGLKRVYDEKLMAAETAAAQPKRPAGAKPSPASPEGGPTSDRQARADKVRRPSPEGVRQSRMDEARKATERGAEDRQRRAERERRERERAQHEARESAERQRRYHAQAQARRTTSGRSGPDRPLNEIIDDVEALLSRFGLDLRTPAEVIWDTLLTWARRLFRDTEPPEAARPRGKPRPQPSFRAKADSRQKAPPQPEPPPQPPPRPRSTFRDGAVDAEFRELRDEPTVDQRAEDLELEQELANLKRGRRDSAPGASGRADSKPPSSPEDEELAALKRKLGKE